MKLSQNFSKTSRQVPSDEVSQNAQLLIRAGYIYKTMAGVYSFLPLGLKVLRKVEEIARKHMDKIGGQEVLMNNLQPKEWWQKADNWDHEKNDALFHLPSQNLEGVEYALSSSNEENVTKIAANYINSWKDLPDFDEKNGVWPLSIYHINTKFRDEKRAKAGLMRGREFRMKDMYDFHKNKESQEKYFEKVTQAYLDFYNEIGLDAKVVNASGGVFSDKFSREFQVVCEAGEDKLFIVDGENIVFNQEVAPCKIGDPDENPEPQKDLQKHHLSNVVGVENLHKYLNVPIKNCIKTLLYTDEKGGLVVAAVRGDREISEEKLASLHKSKIGLATNEEVLQNTGANIGYAGLYNLKNREKLAIYVDDSCKDLKNFECGANEDGVHMTNVNWGRDVFLPEKFVDIKSAIEGDIHPESGKIYTVQKGAEVGNIFDLGKRWTEALGVRFTDENNLQKTPFMGCHGIGISRVIGVTAEIFNDEKGLKWPEKIAPFKYHLITFFNEKDDQNIVEKIKNLASEFYEKNWQNVLWDDREDKKMGMGVKLSDADLIGCPWQLILSARNIQNGQIEVKNRQTGEKQMIQINELYSFEK